MHKRYLMFFLLILLSCFSLHAQNISSVNVDDLTDQQIQSIMNEVSVRGLTIEQAAQMARIQGASPFQVEQLKKRIQELDKKLEKKEGLKITENEDPGKLKEDKYSKKDTIVPSQKEQQIFGFKFFNTDKLTFEPPVNVPTPKNYVLGINDELIINVWGASQKTYELVIGSNGAINIPDVGPVYVSGMEFRDARELIKKRLGAIYKGMQGAEPNTFSEVSTGFLRAIKINVIGEAKLPGTFTLPATASAFNALYLSGGPNENGSFRNIHVMRDNKLVKSIDVYDYLINANTDANVQLRDQDVIYIPVYQKRINVSGAFKRTGLYELKENEKLSDLIRYAGGFNEQAYQSQLSITRLTAKEKRILDINQSIFDSFVPQQGDSVFASNVVNRFENRVLISGAIFRPGEYELSNGLTLFDLIHKAEGVKEHYFNRGMIIRLKDDYSPMVLSFNVDEIINGQNNITLQREDKVFIQSIFNLREKRTINIFGEVQYPGEYEFADNMTLKDIIFQAGGFNEAASESFIELARRHNYTESSQIVDEMVKLYQFNIDRNLQIDGDGDAFYLMPFDYIYIRKAPSYHVQRTVYITGEVRYPGAYSIGSKKERVSDLIKRAGGLMPNAFVRGANMKRVSTQMEKNLNVLQNTIEDSLLTKVESQISNAQLELRLESILKNPGTEFDYLLKDGDQIFIPEISQEVRISGEIRNPIGLAYEDGRSLLYYVDRNGGFGDNAKKNKVFVIYSDGTTKVTRNLLFPVYPEIQPGCQIIIPPKPEKMRIDNTGKWLSVASTLSSIMLVISTIANK